MTFFRRFKISIAFVVAGALLLALGGQWFVLQGVAWTRMAVAFSHTDSVSTALKKTFDGKHPCNLCQEIRKHQDTDREKPTPAQVVFEIKVSPFFLTAQAFIAPPQARTFRYSLHHDYPTVRRQIPPTPPPQTLAVLSA